MKLIGPERYKLKFNRRKFQISATSGQRELSDRVRASRPKLYAVASGRRLVYVGITNQPIRTRLRIGWAADGSHGYYGYAWRRQLKAATLYVWFHTKTKGKAAVRDLEIVEAEVAYLVRKRGQWPAFQTEIHFYPSRAGHRKVAKDVVACVCDVR
ncbi:MAG: hypothetical protein V1809_05730 [Planctomycetota bacterium]